MLHLYFYNVLYLKKFEGVYAKNVITLNHFPQSPSPLDHTYP